MAGGICGPAASTEASSCAGSNRSWFTRKNGERKLPVFVFYELRLGLNGVLTATPVLLQCDLLSLRRRWIQGATATPHGCRPTFTVAITFRVRVSITLIVSDNPSAV
jgi:hypothetical protein